MPRCAAASSVVAISEAYARIGRPRLNRRDHDDRTRGSVQDLVARWWWNYDEGNFDVLTGLLTEDVHFIVPHRHRRHRLRGVRAADYSGRDAVMAWQTDHRRNSPYPLRHNGTNVHITEQRGDEASFSSYIFVSQIVGGVSPLSTAIVNGRVRRQGDALLLAELEVVLDTMDSKVFTAR